MVYYLFGGTEGGFADVVVSFCSLLGQYRCNDTLDNSHWDRVFASLLLKLYVMTKGAPRFRGKGEGQRERGCYLLSGKKS